MTSPRKFLWAFALSLALGVAWFLWPSGTPAPTRAAERKGALEVPQSSTELRLIPSKSADVARDSRQPTLANRSEIAAQEDAPEPPSTELLTSWYSLLSNSGIESLGLLLHLPRTWKRSDLRGFRLAVESSGLTAHELLLAADPAIQPNEGLRAVARMATAFSAGFDSSDSERLGRDLARIPDSNEAWNSFDLDRAGALFALLHRGESSRLGGAYRELRRGWPDKLDEFAPGQGFFTSQYLSVAFDLGLEVEPGLIEFVSDSEFGLAFGTTAAWRHRISTLGDLVGAAERAATGQPGSGFPRQALAATKEPWARANLLDIFDSAPKTVSGRYLRGSAACGLLGIGDQASLTAFEDLFGQATPDGEPPAFIKMALSEDLTIPAAVNAISLLDSRRLSAGHRKILLEQILKQVRPLGWSPALQDLGIGARERLSQAMTTYANDEEYLAKLKQLQELLP